MGNERPSASVLVIRAWEESHPTAPLRIVITAAPDVTNCQPDVRTVASIDEACAVVRAWLEAVLQEP